MRTYLWLLLPCLILGACAGPRAATDPGPLEPEPEEPATEEAVVLADYETFDADAYRDEPAAAAALQHDVPAELMQGRAGEGATRSVQGFRIQITQTQDKAAADATVDEALSWWQEQGEAPSASPLFRQPQPPVYTRYIQPYYRVRVGNFTSRDEANRLLRIVRQRFPSALVVPDTVTVREN